MTPDQDRPLPSTLRALQVQRLRETVLWACDRLDTVRARMRKHGVSPSDIKDRDDIRRLPFTDKADLHDAYPTGAFAVPLDQLARIHASSGSLGNPTLAAYTKEDISVWTNVVTRTLIACGVTSHDVVQNAYTYGLFTGGLGLHYGIEALGATVIPTSAGNTMRQAQLLADLSVTALCCTPSYFVHLAESAFEQGISLADTKLRTGLFGAEPWSEQLRRRMEGPTGIEAFDIYGLSEVIGPGVASECHRHCGLHVFEDHFLPEIVDPVTGEALRDGEEGELVLTTLTKRAMPLLRYRTRDITALIPGRCECGRTLRRIQRISKRADDLIIVRGVNIFPAKIEASLLSVDDLAPHFRVLLTRARGLDKIEVQVERSPHIASPDREMLSRIRSKTSSLLKSALGIRVDVRLLDPGALPRSAGKTSRVVDQREGPVPTGSRIA